MARYASHGTTELTGTASHDIAGDIVIPSLRTRTATSIVGNSKQGVYGCCYHRPGDLSHSALMPKIEESTRRYQYADDFSLLSLPPHASIPRLVADLPAPHPVGALLPVSRERCIAKGHRCCM